jgi:hypothetical protein
MEVRFTPKQEADLSKIAADTGTDVEQFVKNAALRMMEENAAFHEVVLVGLEQANRGEFIEEEEMDSRFELMLQPK